MPVRKAVAGDGAGIISCINDMWSYLRPRNALGGSTKDWTIKTLQAWQAAGYEGVVYANSKADGRIDSVTIGKIENHIHPPAVVSQPWLAIKIMAIRASSVPDNTAAHQRLLMLPLKVAIPDIVERVPDIAGVVCQYSATWQRLHNFLATWSRAEFEAMGESERCWLPILPGLPEFTPRAATIKE